MMLPDLIGKSTSESGTWRNPSIDIEKIARITGYNGLTASKSI
jgi:hypothetical protein